MKRLTPMAATAIKTRPGNLRPVAEVMLFLGLILACVGCGGDMSSTVCTGLLDTGTPARAGAPIGEPAVLEKLARQFIQNCIDGDETSARNLRDPRSAKGFDGSWQQCARLAGCETRNIGEKVSALGSTQVTIALEPACGGDDSGPPVGRVSLVLQPYPSGSNCWYVQSWALK